MKRTVFNDAQLELLHVMSNIRTEEELRELKQVLSEFFARRAQKGLDELWEKGIIDESKLEEWRTAHFRTSYEG